MITLFILAEVILVVAVTVSIATGWDMDLRDLLFGWHHRKAERQREVRYRRYQERWWAPVEEWIMQYEADQLLLTYDEFTARQASVLWEKYILAYYDYPIGKTKRPDPPDPGA